MREQRAILTGRSTLSASRAIWRASPPAIDLPLARRLGADLRALAVRDGVAVVLALHQIALARALADRILGVKEGAIVFDGPTNAFDDEAEARIFSSPATGAGKV